MAWPTNPRPAKSLLVLRDQIDARWPTRAIGNDGMLASAQHHAANPTSDHEPNVAGVVTAIDITKDPTVGLDSRAIAQALLDSRDPRIKYIISDGQICSSKVSPWVWRPYSGADDHSHHFHLSVDANPALYDDVRPWKFSTGGAPSGLLPHSGKGSWYSQYVGKFTWVDTGDAPGSAALGVPDDAQGVSFYDAATLGKWFQVRAPNGVTSLEQQTDIGPSPNTGRLIDISAAAAERFGYSPKTFPTDGIFSWGITPQPALVDGLSPQQQAVKYRDTRSAAPPPLLPPAPVPTGASTGTPAPPRAPTPTTEPTMNNPFALLKFLPLIFRLIQFVPQIQAALKSGSIFTLLPTLAPQLMAIFQELGADLFPTLPPDAQAKAGAVIADPAKVLFVQNAINTLGLASPPLVADGHYGQITKAAVEAFQTAHGMTVDGWAGDVTAAALQAELDKRPKA